MGNRIGDIVNDIIGRGKADGKAKEDVLEGIKKQLCDAGFNVSVVSFEAQKSDETQNKEDEKECDCLTCVINKSLKDSEYWKPENVKKRPKYKIMEKGLQDNAGNCFGNWIDVFTGNKAHLEDSLKELEKAIKEVEMCKLAEIVIMENIQRLSKSEP